MARRECGGVSSRCASAKAHCPSTGHMASCIGMIGTLGSCAAVRRPLPSLSGGGTLKVRHYISCLSAPIARSGDSEVIEASFLHPKMPHPLSSLTLNSERHANSNSSERERENFKKTN